jgi:outer membrane lipoprotein-sorting protein
MAAAYEKVTTYSDTGILTITNNSGNPRTVTAQLKTWFARPHYFRLEISRPPNRVTVAWSDGETHRVWESPPGVVETVPLEKVLWGMDHDIISLLEPKLSGPLRLHQLSSPLMLPKESVEGAECFHLKGTLRANLCEVWIATSDRLARKIKYWWQDYIFETAYNDIVVDGQIPAEIFDFRPPEAVKR